MTRDANAVDFWRGFALIEILINHVPGNFYERFTHRTLSVSDAAELFVFLAGWSLAYVVGRPERRAPLPGLVFRLGGRAFVVYAAHILTMMLAVAMLAGASLAFDNTLYLEWHNAGPVFQDPVETHVGLALLSHQLGYFNILPLYVALLVVAPGIAVLHRLSPALLALASGGVYLAALIVPITIPTWPVPGQWFFNPLCWQFLFVIGFLAARPEGLGGFLARHLTWLRRIAWPIVIAGAAVAWFDLHPDPTRAPWPPLLFITGKTFLTPIRLIHFLALAVALSSLYPVIARHAEPLTRAVSRLGRHSLQTFCAGSVLSLLGQILRFATGGGLVFDTLFVAVGLAGMSAVAWAVEWRERAR
ncbi:MAG: OpgC domain-containing protein [Rhizobiales bacterium]|nr:OpgC domain-containing protein [Hyphomicrobiales bacterium]